MSVMEHKAARMVCVGFDGPAATNDLRQLVARGVSSVVLLSRNYQSPAQLSDLCREIKSLANRLIMICIDQEGGRVQRLREPFTIIPPMRDLGGTNDPELSRRVGEVIAAELRAVNIDMNLAPVLDVDSNPTNPVIGARSFGPDAQRVAALACAMIAGLQSAGIAACGKHFPGHGDTSVDSHDDLPRIAHDLSRLQLIELPPFAAAVKAGVAAIMTAHIVVQSLDSKFPATLSASIVDQILRKQFQFNGVVISDDLEMKAIANHFGFEETVTHGVSAGVDLFMVCHSPELQHRAIDTLAKGFEQRPIDRARNEQSNHRLDALFARFVQPTHPHDARMMSVIGGNKHRQIIAEIVQSLSASRPQAARAWRPA